MGNKNDENGKTLFVTLNNPLAHGFSGSPKEVCRQAKERWISGHEKREGKWVYSVSGNGLYHLHMTLFDPDNTTFAEVKRIYKCPNIQIKKGTKTQAMDYLYKTGKFKDSAEFVLASDGHGSMLDCSGRRTDLIRAKQLMVEGKALYEILNEEPWLDRSRQDIRKEFYARKRTELPLEKKKLIHYVFGPSSRGEYPLYASLCKHEGADKVYRISSYNPGMFDNYLGEPILLLEYVDDIPYDRLMQLLSPNPEDIQARYTNVCNTWSEVYILSRHSPHVLFEKLSPANESPQEFLKFVYRLTDCEEYTFDWAGQVLRRKVDLDNYAFALNSASA